MLFNSLKFLIFFPAVVLLYFVLPKRVRNLWLLVASYVFYMGWNAKYVVLLFTSTLITYLSGLLLERVKGSDQPETKKTALKKWVVAGPIERSKNLLQQLDTPKSFDFDRAREGFVLMLWGYFLKIVLADRIAIFVDTVYGDIAAFPGWYLIAATVLFAVQIYCDFGGYEEKKFSELPGRSGAGSPGHCPAERPVSADGYGFPGDRH